MSKAFLVYLLLCTSFALSISKHTKDHLSNKDHYVDGEHNEDYDHDAFLGDEANTYDNLSPEESKTRLSSLVSSKIDSNLDSSVSKEELVEWIRLQESKSLEMDVEGEWQQFSSRLKDGGITWEIYTGDYYDDDQDEELDEENQISVKKMRERDERRWKHADADKDGVLSKKEFADFLHPEDSPRMAVSVIAETLEDVDKDGDGKINLKEYLGDMGGTDEEWVKSETSIFESVRDKNKDGFLTDDEVKDWILPEDGSQAQGEAEHLIAEADSDKDGVLSLEEILNKYDTFVGSQATDFGDLLQREEL